MSNEKAPIFPAAVMAALQRIPWGVDERVAGPPDPIPPAPAAPIFGNASKALETRSQMPVLGTRHPPGAIDKIIDKLTAV